MRRLRTKRKAQSDLGWKMGKVGKVGSTLVCSFLVVSEKAEGGMRFVLGGFFLSYSTLPTCSLSTLTVWDTQMVNLQTDLSIGKALGPHQN